MLADDKWRPAQTLRKVVADPMRPEPAAGGTLGSMQTARPQTRCERPTQGRRAAHARFLIFGVHIAIGLVVAGCRQSAPVPEQAKAADGLLDASAVRSRLAVRTVGTEKDGKAVVILGKPTAAREVPDFKQPSRVDMLPREMVRQAVLIAVRDELGLATRDQVIDDAVPDSTETGNGTIEVVSYIRDKRSHEIIRRLENERSETILDHETPTKPGRELELLKLLASAEALSRQEFPAALKGIGLAGKPNAVKNEGALPENVEARLASIELLDALLAVRDVHKAIHDDGESPVRLGALARGYALLGILSEFQWHPAHRAFKARAILYAQRMIARNPDQPDGFWNRAFALALIGRHSDALADLDVAKKSAGISGSRPTPDWVELVDAYARFDTKRLGGMEGPRKNVAALLRMFTLAYPRSMAIGLHAASDVVVLQPYCFRAHDVMSEYFGVSTQHATTMMGPQAFQQYLLRRLPATRELPAHLRNEIEGQSSSAQIAELMDAAGAAESDMGEPAWGVMGHLIRETQFVQVFRRVFFVRYMLGSPADDVWNELRSDVAAHRYGPYLEALALPEKVTGEQFRKFADSVDLIDLEPTATEMERALQNDGGAKAKDAGFIAMAHADETAEMAMYLEHANESIKVQIALDLLKTSPYHPYARGTLIAKAWEKVKDQVPIWEKEGADSPALFAALGLHYSQSKNYADAERTLSRLIELSPDAWAYRQLAANFKVQGKVDRWQETLEDYLKNVEDLGLDHAKARVQIADHFMELKQWDKARPYAEAAAGTWAQWAMECAARCAEGQKDWKGAETWYSRSTERYPDNSWAVWYFFCKRTGEGNLEAARAFVEQYITSHADRPDLLNPEYPGCFFWLEGRLEQAKAAFYKAYEKDSSVFAALCLAMLADDAKDSSRRDALLRDIVTKHANKAPKTAAICKLFLETVFDSSGKKPLDIVAVDQLIDSTPDDGRGNRSHFVGWFLKNHGDAKIAKKYLERSSDSPSTMIWNRYLADDAIRHLTGG